jgi:hypothetical protein
MEQMMNEQSKNDLQMLINKGWDPRRGLGKRLGAIRYWILISFVGFIVVGFIVSIPWLHFLFIPLIILVFLLPKGIQKRTRARALKSDWFLCPWCRYSLVGLEDQGVCPECGSGYRKDVCVKLYQYAYKGYEPDPQVLRDRESEAWQEAIELRDVIL